MQSIQNLLMEVNGKVTALETAKQLYSQQLAPDFNIFNYIAINETNLSYILADLLNPQGSHGQKDLFLHKFIEICLPNLQNQPTWIAQNFHNHLSDTLVFTEDTNYASASLRRMDIYLQVKNGSNSHFGICIENKPYAHEQENQVKDYGIELEQRHKHNFHMIYLCEFGEPSKYSIPESMLKEWKDKKRSCFSHVKFSDLIPWLNACKIECKNPSVVEFLNQFIRFIQKQFMGMKDMSETNAILEIAQANANNIVSAIKISSLVEDMKKNLIQKLISQLEVKSPSEKYHIETDGIDPYQNFQNIKFKINGLQDFDIVIQFEHKQYRAFFIGIWTLNENHIGNEKFNKILQTIKEHLPLKNTKSENGWCIWYDLEPADWNNSPEVWGEIQDGIVAEKILNEVDTLYRILKDNHLITNT